MEFSMKSVKGLLFIIASFILTLLTWMNTSPQFMIPGLALTSLSLTFILATRLPLLESWFHSLEKVYTVHKFTAFLSIILLIFHNFSMGGFVGLSLSCSIWQSCHLYLCQHHPCRLFRQIHPIRSLAMDSPPGLPSLYFRTLSHLHDNGQSSPYI